MGRTRNRIHREWRKFLARHIYRGRLYPVPDSLVIETTNICTLHCSCCPNGFAAGKCRPRHSMTANECSQLLENIDMPIRSVFLHLHGEPFINKELPTIADMLLKKGVTNFTIFSNGYNIDIATLEEILKRTSKGNWTIAFSAEIYDRKQYESIRCPGNYNTLLEQYKSIDAMMDKYNMGYSINSIIDFTDIEGLRKEIPTIFQTLSRLESIHFNSRFPWPYHPESGDLAGRLKSRRSICTQISELPVVLSNGDVSMCSSDYRGDCIVGSLHTEKYSRIINNWAARQFRLNHLNHHAEKNYPCHECLIDRYKGFTRQINRKFALSASAENLTKFFDSFKKHYVEA